MRLPVLRLSLAVLMVIAFLACNKGGRYEDDDDDDGDGQTPGFSLSGTIGVAENTAVDSDTNDDGAAIADNDNFGQAQELSVPVVLGGYVNTRNKGSEGNSLSSGDPSDFYRLSLGVGQLIQLSFPSSLETDIQLLLYDTERNLVDSSLSDSNILTITIATAGTYYLEVYAVAGASNYNLSIYPAEYEAAAKGSSDHSQLRLSDDFVHGQAIVEMAAGEAAAGARSAHLLSAAGLDPDPEKWPQLICFPVGGNPTGLVRSLGVTKDDVHRSRIDPGAPELLAKWDTLQVIRRLRTQLGNRIVEPNYRLQALALSPDDAFFDLQWHYPLINLPKAWELTTGNAEVIVAVIDSGVLLDHPDLQGQLVAGYDFISDAANANDGDGRDADPSDPGDSLEGNSSFHGTHVTGTIAALSDNGSGVAGAGWNTRVMPLRVLGIEGADSNDLIQALRYASGLSNESEATPERSADIINLSLGGGDFSRIMQNTIDAVRSAGVIVVAAAGNSSSATISYPAGYAGVISVSAVDSQIDLAPYSSYGETVDIAAPGGDTWNDRDADGYTDGILSTCGEEDGASLSEINMTYCFLHGTSMAAPHVSAVAALMKAVDTDMTPDQFYARLINHELTRDIGEAGWDADFGYGLIDAYKAVLSALENAPTVVFFEPAALSFNRTATELALAVSRVGDGVLRIISVTSNADWLQIRGNDLDTDGFGTYLVSADRTDLADGIYHATLSFETSADTQRVDVGMQVLAGTTPGQLAKHYVLLVDSTTGEVVGNAQAVDADGAFSMDGVAAGSYFLYAGSDMNNDNHLGDSGEAYGAYPSLDNPISLTITEDRSDLDIHTAFRIALPSVVAPEAGIQVERKW